MERSKPSNPLAVISIGVVIIGIAATALVPWMGEMTLPSIAAGGLLVGIPALLRAQRGASGRGLAIASVLLGTLALVLFLSLKIFRT